MRNNNILICLRFLRIQTPSLLKALNLIKGIFALKNAYKIKTSKCYSAVAASILSSYTKENWTIFKYYGLTIEMKGLLSEI